MNEKRASVWAAGIVYEREIPDEPKDFDQAKSRGEGEGSGFGPKEYKYYNAIMDVVLGMEVDGARDAHRLAGLAMALSHYYFACMHLGFPHDEMKAKLFKSLGTTFDVVAGDLQTQLERFEVHGDI